METTDMLIIEEISDIIVITVGTMDNIFICKSQTADKMLMTFGDYRQYFVSRGDKEDNRKHVDKSGHRKLYIDNSEDYRQHADNLGYWIVETTLY